MKPARRRKEGLLKTPQSSKLQKGLNSGGWYTEVVFGDRKICVQNVSKDSSSKSLLCVTWGWFGQWVAMEMSTGSSTCLPASSLWGCLQDWLDCPLTMPVNASPFITWASALSTSSPEMFFFSEILYPLFILWSSKVDSPDIFLVPKASKENNNLGFWKPGLYSKSQLFYLFTGFLKGLTGSPIPLIKRL